MVEGKSLEMQAAEAIFDVLYSFLGLEVKRVRFVRKNVGTTDEEAPIVAVNIELIKEGE